MNESKKRSAALIGATDADKEVSFYQHFVALHLHGLEDGGVLRMEVINRLQEIIAANEMVKMFCFSTVSAGLRAKDREKPRSGPAPRCWRSCAEL